MDTGLLIFSFCIAVFAMVAKRLASTIVTAPMYFILLGVVFASSGILPTTEMEPILHLVAETALIILLFLDAAQIDLSKLRSGQQWPLRMLIVGLPLAVVLGTLAAWLFLPGWPVVALALVAALLAPTDAALGQPVLTNPQVPEKVRQTLTVESGLNDGLALPVILLFASLSADVMTSENHNWILFGIKQITLGPVVGIVFGFLGGKSMLLARKLDLTADTFEGIAALALALGTYLAAGEVGGNGFIAAFVAGLTFGSIVKGKCKFVFEFTEGEGQLLTWLSFFLLGLVLVPEAVHQLTPAITGLILVSLFLVRPIAVWISLLWTDTSVISRLFFGWFGPRGLATALFALLVLPEIDHEIADTVLAIAINAVWISALLHGISAAPLATYYGKHVKSMGECAETQAVSPPFTD
jgi:NhaP-type Na+/H+ or K+/H+ antiporter